MLADLVLKCPVCLTDDYLYASPTKHATHIECEECHTQFVIPNDGGEKVADNLLIQQLTSVPDFFFAGYFGVKTKKDDEMNWVLTGIVSEEKKDALEEQLKKKVEMFSKLDDIVRAEYKVQEYKAGEVTPRWSFAFCTTNISDGCFEIIVRLDNSDKFPDIKDDDIRGSEPGLEEAITSLDIDNELENCCFSGDKNGKTNDEIRKHLEGFGLTYDSSLEVNF